ncbi:ubiquitin-associated protein 2-like isoform X7 [Serinus canaria]|uniref:ubiquitin-associated protein 2-like isoform X7 n=1 Tax=Serinus canaria TaxID=9135 RepID=UPI0021CC66C2|nr:ubiquitin-associated protein 2-like isoform X7 [Serinus canaria]
MFITALDTCGNCSLKMTCVLLGSSDFLFCTYIVLYILYMMTSVVTERTRGTRDKMQISASQPTQPQKQVVQATAEQIRLAQMIYDKNDTDFEDKVKQLMEVTGKNQDECIVALHDCNGDMNRAINILLEGNSDTTSWETVGGKKKNLGKEGFENKENREKRGDREMSRGWGSSNRWGRGGSRGREFRAEENGMDNSQGDRPSDRGKRSRGRGAWKNSVEEWTAEDWNEDEKKKKPGSVVEGADLLSQTPGGPGRPRSGPEPLSEAKVFTASSVPAENHMTPRQSIDLVTMLQKPEKPVTLIQETEGNSFEAPQQQTFGQALVFTNSQHSTQMASGTGSSSAVNSYSPQSLSAVLCPGFRERGSPKLTNSTGSQILNQLKSPGLGHFTSQQNNNSSTTTTTSSWDQKPPITQASVLSQFDLKSQPQPSPVLIHLTQRQQQQTQTSPVPPPGLESFSQVKLHEPLPVDTSTAVSKMLQLPTISMDNQEVTAHQTQQKQLKPPKRRTTPASKIPVSAVEMPGSADVTGLNVQFGALEFGSEPTLTEFGSTSSSENTSQAINNSLYSKSVNDPLNTSLPISSTVQESTYTTSAVNSSSVTCSSQSTSPVTTSSYEQTSVLSRIVYESSMAPSEPTPVAVTNGHNSVRTQATPDTTSSVPVLKTEPSPSLPSAGSLPSMVSTTASLLPSASQHVGTLPSFSQSSDLASSSLSQLSSSLSNHQSSLSPASVLSSSTSHVHTSVENTTSLQPSTTFSTASTSATSTTSSVVSMASSMNTTASLGLSVTSVSATSRAAPLMSSGKAPPNLPQGVSPLLHNQYIVGPGGLLPAYPQIYGYDDLQMLQSRLPMDYYGITFPAPATLTGRDGSLANNPFSGDVTKFGCGDSASPAPATTLAQSQQNQTQTHHTTQQPFLNPTLPPGYSFTGLPYYAGVPGVPSAFQYGPTMFVPPASAKQHGVNLNTTSTPFQQGSGYGQHGYGAGYDDLTQGTAAGDYSKGGYSGSSQAQNKSAGTGPGKGVSVTSSNTGVPDISGSVYNKTQTFDKQGFHAGTPPSFSLPSALGSTGLNPGAAPGYAPAPFLHILPAHQQPHSQMLHHHLQQDGQGGSGQRNQPSTMQQKSQATKTYGTSPYWTN